MSNEHTVLGKIPTGNERDAVHVAVIPVKAGSDLLPGMRVGLLDDGRASGCAVHIGIVDPFLTDVVRAGSMFYLALFPETVTGMRHHWSHPAFSETVDYVDTDASITGVNIDMISEVAALCGVSRGEMLDIAKWYCDHGDMAKDNSMKYRAVSDSQWSLFWEQFEEETGKEVKYKDVPFTCSC